MLTKQDEMELLSLSLSPLRKDHAPVFTTARPSVCGDSTVHRNDSLGGCPEDLLGDCLWHPGQRRARRTQGRKGRARYRTAALTSSVATPNRRLFPIRDLAQRPEGAPPFITVDDDSLRIIPVKSCSLPKKIPWFSKTPHFHTGMWLSGERQCPACSGSCPLRQAIPWDAGDFSFLGHH